MFVLNGVNQSITFNSTVDFNENHGSALAVITSAMLIFQTVRRHHLGRIGPKKAAAISLLGNAVIQVGQKTYLLFENNHASHCWRCYSSPMITLDIKTLSLIPSVL